MDRPDPDPTAGQGLIERASIISEAKSFGSKALWFVAFLTVAAFWLRSAYIQDAAPVEYLIKDARQYADYGFNLAQHATFSLDRNSPAPRPDSFRSPGYPLLIALSIHAGGDRGFYPLMLYVQAVLGALTVLLTFFLCRRFMPTWAALTAAGLVAVCPHLIVMTSYLLTETLFGFLLLAVLVCFQAAFAGRGMPFFLFGGILSGSAYLVNEAVLFLPPLLAGLASV